MGCNESKHDVATGNTITRKKSNDGESKNSKDIETILETDKNDNNTNSLVQQEGENVNNGIEGVDNVVSGADVKDIAENTSKEENGPESLVSKESPNRFYSSRKDEEALDGIVSEGRSEKSEYYSPHVEADNENVKEEESFEEKKLVEETKEETKNGEPSNVNEENLIKEAEVVTTTEATVSSPGGEEKSLNAEKEHSAS